MNQEFLPFSTILLSLSFLWDLRTNMVVFAVGKIVSKYRDVCLREVFCEKTP